MMSDKEISVKNAIQAAVGLIAVALAMGGSVASADEGVIGVRGMGVAPMQPGHLAVEGADTSAGAGAFVGVAPEALAGVRLMASFDRQGSGADSLHSSLDGDLESGWASTRLMAKADWTTGLVGDWLGPLARVGFGYGHQSLRLVADGTEYRGVDHGLSGVVAGGLEAHLAEGLGDDFWSRFSLRANVLVGYHWQSEASFDSMEATDVDDDWQSGSYDAGSMQVSGVTWELGTMIQYRFGQ